MNSEERIADFVRRNPRLSAELLQLVRRTPLPDAERFGISTESIVSVLEGRSFGLEAAGHGRQARALEAIVRRYGRPVLLVRDGSFEPPELQSIRAQLEPHRTRLGYAIHRVGRIEFVNHALPWGGTGWVVDRNVVITNRHVAEIVAEPDERGAFRFAMSLGGVAYEARLNLGEDDRAAAGPVIPLKRVRYLASADQPDIALLEVDVDGHLPDPLDLSSKVVHLDQPVVIIGYPAYDSRNDVHDIARYFGDTFDVKRLAPGVVTQVPGPQPFFMHDATTLGGNSGSIVLDPGSGEAVGLHYAGTYLKGNYAVTAADVKRALRGLKILVVVPDNLTEGGEARADGWHDAAYFLGREGYDGQFLGAGDLCVPPLGLEDWSGDTAVAEADSGGKTKLLAYTHFSVAFSRSRRLPIFTAVNIDGAAAQRIKRVTDRWYRDGRLPLELQLTRDDYAQADIDRGHMVRREDPSWGTPAEARLANDDTFHYTNAAPQHAQLNRATAQWLGLEDYVLGSAKTHGFRICVFTGPVLRSCDRRLDNGLQVPEEFWKVIVAVDERTGGLRSTGYVLSQGRLIAKITESFSYGRYRTYQVPVEAIAEVTGLDFGRLVGVDALRTPVPEALPGVSRVIALDRLGSMVL